MHPYERAVLRSYLVNLAHFDRREWERLWRKSYLTKWIDLHHRELGWARSAPDPIDEDRMAPRSRIEDNDRDATAEHLAIAENISRSTHDPQSEQRGDAWRQVLTKLYPVALPQGISSIERRVRWISDLTGLNHVERTILGFIVRASVSEMTWQLVGALLGGSSFESDFACRRQDVTFQLIAGLLGLTRQRARRALAADGKLRLFGLVLGSHDEFTITDITFALMTESRLTMDRARAMLLGKPRRTRLDWTDFQHLGADAELAWDLVRRGLAEREKGINILLYGAPGTGKSEFACALAERLGLKALFVGEADQAGEEPDRESRVAALTMGQQLTANVDDVLLVVDEADDLFVGVDDTEGANRKGAKVFMNRLVAGSPLPTLWISNHPELLGPAVLRRMAFALHFRAPSRVQRRRMIERIVQHQRFELPPMEVARIAALPAPAAILDHGIRAARLCGGGAQTAIRSASSILAVMEGRAPHPQEEPAPFDEDLSRADRDLKHLTDQVLASGRQKLSFCFTGMPGTGKSAFARHLANRMGLEVMEKRASDLLGAFVGESEARIAAAFREAEAQRAFLIFDEADSLLQDRTKAVRGWEITQVNEMLTWMERHPLPFACTTNFADSLDPATSRRFLFKVRFLPMEWWQIQLAFRRFFSREAPACLAREDRLVAGDFAVVAGKAMVLGLSDPVSLAEELLAEVAAKPEGRARAIGFRAA
ncbi:AAA family ATPase [Xanthobacter sediminis]|uniref:AAA family ATPase n=1 Tax=Xanthobacter sediminis TaxID=3119926 RepID=UPI00372AE9E3